MPSERANLPQGYDRQAIAARFRQARLHHLSGDGRKLTMAELGELLGTDKNSINHKERGSSLVVADLYCLHRLGLNLGWLLTGEGEPRVGERSPTKRRPKYQQSDWADGFKEAGNGFVHYKGLHFRIDKQKMVGHVIARLTNFPTIDAEFEPVTEFHGIDIDDIKAQIIQFIDSEARP